ncbi:DUF5675 family protein [Fulvivirgaceae bacterium BMA10]|uniref:DUF5675 family protein n=1 Tax=Splendidivirga corallicola TaxID=3051826 RepID=A0ABT8KQ95_9BACT|nr:DUF5675 family protein [Fulvivirgaceae bacterium BMA10]
MKRIVFLIFIGIITFAVIYFIKNPDMLEDIWLWIVGLVGLIGQSVKSFYNYIIEKLSLKDNAEPGKQNPDLLKGSIPRELPAELVKKNQTPAFKGITLTVLRFSRDEDTTIGLLYLNKQFYCYTLEDTYQEVKVPGQTRIPAGTYALDFLKSDTPLTLKYRRNFPNWFQYHLEIKEIPGFTGVYIHRGGTHKDTKGCLLVSDSLTIAKGKEVFTNSTNTFERLYRFLKEKIEQGTKARIIIKDESWITALKQ